MASVAAVIAGFNPESATLLSLVSRLVSERLPVLVVDDGSRDPTYLSESAERGAVTLAHPTNAGIARSLNDGLAFAREWGVRWLLTVDQDTVLPDGYVQALLSQTNVQVGVVGAERIEDPSGSLTYPMRRLETSLVTEEVFQTGSLWSVQALTHVGGFDETLGIDAVDAAACLALRENGYLVALAPGTRLEHRYGESQAKRILGRTVMATGHSPARRETMVRNRLALFPREFRESPVHALRTIRRLVVNVVLGITIEQDRWEKAKGAARGLRPRKGQYPPGRP